MIDYTNAGHNPPYILHADGSVEMLQNDGNLVLGVMEDMKFKRSSLQLNPGDRLFLYTDGLTEAKNPEGGLFGDERLLQQMATTQRRSVKETIHQLNEAIGQHRNGAEASDDLTMMCLSIT